MWQNVFGVRNSHRCCCWLGCHLCTVIPVANQRSRSRWSHHTSHTVTNPHENLQWQLAKPYHCDTWPWWRVHFFNCQRSGCLLSHTQVRLWLWTGQFNRKNNCKSTTHLPLDKDKKPTASLPQAENVALITLLLDISEKHYTREQTARLLYG